MLNSFRLSNVLESCSFSPALNSAQEPKIRCSPAETSLQTSLHGSMRRCHTGCHVFVTKKCLSLAGAAAVRSVAECGGQGRLQPTDCSPSELASGTQSSPGWPFVSRLIRLSVTAVAAVPLFSALSPQPPPPSLQPQPQPPRADRPHSLLSRARRHDHRHASPIAPRAHPRSTAVIVASSAVAPAVSSP